MKRGRNLQELAAEIERQRDARADYIAPTAKTKMVVAGNEPRLALVGHVPMPMNGLAHGQLAEYAGIPKAYYDSMLAQKPELLAHNVNGWLADKDEQRMVRTLDGRVRALLSDRYRPLENHDLAEAVLPVLLERKLVIVSSEITERRLYIKAFDEGISAEIEKSGYDPAHAFLKDVCFAAITISNSEVGAGALSIAAGLYTGGCTNFASFSDSRMRKYHVGGKALESEDVQAMFSERTKKLTDAAIWAQTRDVVGSAFEQARFRSLVERVQETTVQKIEGDVVKVVELVGERLGFTKGERGSVLKHLIEGGDLSRFGLFNAVTRTAEDLEDYERATDFERAGGKVIELPRSEWEELAKAA